MRDRFPLLLLGGLLLFGFVAATLMKGARRGDFADKLSTFRADKDGARALYVLADESGLPVTRSQEDLLTPTDGQPLVLLGAEFEPGEKSESGVKKKLAHQKKQPAHDDKDDDRDDDDSDDADAPDGGIALREGLNEIFVSPVSIDEREKLLEHIKKGNTVIYALPNAAAAQDNAFLKAIDVYAYPPAKTVPMRSLVPEVPTPFTLGVERTEAKVETFLDAPDDATPLLVDDRTDEPAVVLVPYGNGQVVVIGAPELAMNQTLARADNAQFWLSLLQATAGTRATAFDEFHHGFSGGRSIAEFARHYGLQYAIAQLLVGLCLWALALKRFGRPKPPPEDVRVGSTDALFATSRLYREGKHCAFAAGLIFKELSQELAHLAGLPARSDPRAIGDALRARDHGRVAAAYEAVIGRMKNVTTEADVMAIAKLAAQTRALSQKKQTSSSITSHAA